MDNTYSFEQLWKDLNKGYEIFYTYMDIRYLLVKLKSNCYSKQIIKCDDKSPQPRNQIVTLKSIKEIFEFMEDIEYKIS